MNKWSMVMFWCTSHSPVTLALVLIETYWVLNKYYNLAKDDILKSFEDYIESEEVELEEENLIQRVLARFREVNVDFVDVYIAEKSRSLTLPILTYK